MALVLKDPEARIDYCFDWGEAYLASQVIVASNWIISPVEPGGLSVMLAGHDMLASSVTLAEGIAGHRYRVTNRVTMSDGQIDDRSFTVRVDER